jgi:carbonic anhydrase/acetyltransferase-like protein (isoleucine patch superfamily)
VKALLVETGRTIAPFGDAPGEACFADSTVGETVRAQLARRGLEVVTDPEAAADDDCVVLADHAFVSDRALGEFLAAALGAEGPERLALCHTPSTRYVTPVSSIEVEPLDESGPGARPDKPQKTDAAATERACFDVFYAPKGKLPLEDTLETLRREASRRVIGKRELVRDVRMPTLGDEQQRILQYPVTSTVAAHVEHWVHVLWLNHLAFGVRWGEIARGHKAWVFGKAIRTFPPTLPNVLRSMVRKGKGVQIHPTAYVEGSILGDGVVIGARASVRNSVIGAGAEIGDHATVIASTVGESAFVTPRTFVVWSTCYPESVISNYKVQMSVVGRGAATSTWAGFIDAKFQGSIDVFLGGEKRSTERSFLGSCIGHDAFIGAKVLLLPGREIPNGSFVAMRPDELISTIPDDLAPGEPVVRHEGTLVPLRELRGR